MSKIVMTTNTNEQKNRLASGINIADFMSEKTIGDFHISLIVDMNIIEYNGERVHSITFIDNVETGYTDLILKLESPHGLKELKLNKYAETLDFNFIQIKIELKKLAKNTNRINENTRVFDFTNR